MGVQGKESEGCSGWVAEAVGDIITTMWPYQEIQEIFVFDIQKPNRLYPLKKIFQTKPNEFSISFEMHFSIGFYLYSPAWSYSLYCIIYNSGWSITSEYPLGCLSNLFVHLLHYQPQMCAEVVFDLFLMFQELAGEPIKRSLK